MHNVAVSHVSFSYTRTHGDMRISADARIFTNQWLRLLSAVILPMFPRVLSVQRQY